jgi:hypothetical protein
MCEGQLALCTRVLAWLQQRRALHHSLHLETCMQITASTLSKIPLVDAYSLLALHRYACVQNHKRMRLSLVSSAHKHTICYFG